MTETLSNNQIFGLVLTLTPYVLAQLLYRKSRIQLLNPFVLSLGAILAVLLILDIPVSRYMLGGKYITAVLPLTILLLALPLYRQLPLLMVHKLPILAGVLAGVITSGVSVISLSLLLGVDKQLIQSVVPKCITSPLGLILSETLGGIASITVISIVFTGVLGVLAYAPIFKLFRIRHPVAQGIALGTTCHAIGTAKALEISEVTGAMSGLAIILAGVVTVVSAPLFLLIFSFM